MRSFAGLIAAAAFALSPTIAQEKPAAPAPPAEKPAPAKPADSTVTAASATSPLEFKVKDIDGNDVALSKYKGKVVLIVNVASKCGLTPQYKQLQELHEKYGGRGLAILAFPANNFNGQEPRTNAEIKEFCKSEFKVGFDLFSKISVKGDDACDLYSYLTRHTKDEKFHGDIEWNFAKFLVNREGEVIARFKPNIKPDDARLVRQIEAALDTKQP